MMMMVMMTTLFSSGCLPHPKITNYTRAAATAFPGEPFETGETETKRYFLFDQQMVRIFSLWPTEVRIFPLWPTDAEDIFSLTNRWWGWSRVQTWWLLNLIWISPLEQLYSGSKHDNFILIQFSNSSSNIWHLERERNWWSRIFMTSREWEKLFLKITT